MRYIVYNRGGCAQCDQTVKQLKAKGYNVETRDVEALRKGLGRDQYDVEALAGIIMEGGKLPYVIEVKEENL